MEAIDSEIIVRNKSGCKDPDYFKKYCQANNKGVQVCCPRCNKSTSKVNMSKHMKRNICLKVFATGAVEQICENKNVHHEEMENNFKKENIY